MHFFSTTSFPLILYTSDKIFRFPGRNLKPLHVSAKRYPRPKMVTLCFPKKICHLGIKIDWGEKYYLQCIGVNGKAFTLQVYDCLNFLRLLGFLKITCDVMSGRSRNSGYGYSTVQSGNNYDENGITITYSILFF